MGACTFYNEVTAPSAKAAFTKAVQDAQFTYGHGGYSGTIAEKDSFVMIDVPQGEDPKRFAKSLIDNSDARIDDKWGPAGCVEIAKDRWLFFGWASE